MRVKSSDPLVGSRVHINTRVRMAENKEGCSYYEVNVKSTSGSVCVKVLYPAEIRLSVMHENVALKFSKENYTIPSK